MKIQNQHGFGFIELMLSLLVTGILVTIAIPAYQNSKIKAKVSEVMTLSSVAKSKMSEYIMLYGRYPENLEQAGISPVESEYVKSLTIDTKGALILTGNADTLGAELTVVLQARNEGHAVVWSCTSSGEINYAPSSCR